MIVFHHGQQETAPTKSQDAFTLGRSRFERISAVEDIKTSPKVGQLFAEFDRKQLTHEQRRQVIRETFTKKG